MSDPRRSNPNPFPIDWQAVRAVLDVTPWRHTIPGDRGFREVILWGRDHLRDVPRGLLPAQRDLVAGAADRGLFILFHPVGGYVTAGEWEAGG